MSFLAKAERTSAISVASKSLNTNTVKVVFNFFLMRSFNQACESCVPLNLLRHEQITFLATTSAISMVICLKSTIHQILKLF
jgi:hypothetical protein